MSAPPMSMDFEIRKWSSLEAMCLSPDRLLVQVYKLLVVLMSTNANSLIKMSKEVFEALKEGTPPFFPQGFG